jgi:hypothetical protein
MSTDASVADSGASIAPAPAAQPSPAEVQPPIAQETQTPDAASLAKELEATKRQLATVSGGANTARKEAADLRQQIAQVSQRLAEQETRDRQSRREADLAEKRALGWTDAEIAQAKAIFEREDNLEQREARLRQHEPVLQEVNKELERQSYIRQSLKLANDDLKAAGVATPISLDELVSQFDAPPEYQGEVEAKMRKLVIKRLTDADNERRRASLNDERDDHRMATGRNTVSTLDQAERAYSEGQMSYSDFAQFVAKARSNRTNGY